MNVPELLTRLQDTTPGAPLDQLAELLVEDALGRPMAELLPPSLTARALKEALEGWLASERAEPALAAALEEARRALEADGRTLTQALPRELVAGLIELVRRPHTPEPAVVRAVLEPAPVRRLLRELMLQVVLDFGRKLRAPVADSRVARGLGGLAKLAAEQAKAKTGALGTLASDFVGAVSGEVERQLERRANEFVDSALSGLLDRISDALANPTHVGNQATIRVAIVESLLGLELPVLGRQLGRADVPGGAKVARRALSRWLARAESLAALERVVGALQRRSGARPLREVLEEAGLLEPARAFGRELLRARLAPFFRSEAFARWMQALMGQD